MKKILIPVDGSNASKSSLRYGFELSRLHGFKLVILMVNTKEGSDKAGELQSLKHFTHFPPHENEASILKSKIDYRVEDGNIVSTIEKVATEEQVEFILIGTRKKHTLKDYLLGSVCTRLTKVAKSPILIIPENYRFEPIDFICYLQDVVADQNEDPLWLLEYAKLFNARLEKLYVNPVPKDFFSEKVNTFAMPESSDFDQLNVVRDTSLKRGIDYFLQLQDSKVTLLAIYLKDRSWFQQFMHSNLSRQLILKSSTPILIKNDMP